MLYGAISVLLRTVGLKPSIGIFLLINCALLSLSLQQSGLIVALLLFGFNSYLLSGILFIADKDIVQLKELLTNEEKLQQEGIEDNFSGILTSALPSIFSRIRQDSRSLQEHMDANAEIGYSAQELHLKAEKLADNIKSQSMATTSIAAAVTEISHSIDDIAGRMKEAYSIAKDVDHLSKEGTDIIKDSRSNTEEVAEYAEATYELLAKLDANTTNVASISSVIREIAEQTNLLALNAAIEAARAGEHGRGFAVVADEVRALANRSHTSANEISDNINDVQTQMKTVRDSMNKVVQCTENSVGKAKAAEDILNTIVDNTQTVSDALYSISSATDQQTAAAREISANIEQVTVVADENSDISYQSASIANHLHQICS